jgi:hypothetical protein
VRQWARRGTRPRWPADQRYESAYLFGPICPARGVGAALALPCANTEAMQLHLDEISATVAAGAHAVLIFDRADWHTTPNLLVPEDITPIWLPSRAPHSGISATRPKVTGFRCRALRRQAAWFIRRSTRGRRPRLQATSHKKDLNSS